MDFLGALVHPDYTRACQAVVDNALLSGVDTSSFELKLRLRDNQIRQLLVSASARRDLSGVAVGVIFVASNDITFFQEQQKYLIRTKAEVDFTNFLALEVRNPLSGIDSSSLLLMDAIESMETSEFIILNVFIQRVLSNALYIA
jgi:nitrogen-specific signal transduction histidine kinase